ncbi:hypothetical protein [Streptomyces sp. NPDC004065]|uniref:hypothetical protein n=1 Tax=Streptomyces sp. NPDC004065 TaxID=3364689 RepID=UPI00384FCA85
MAEERGSGSRRMPRCEGADRLVTALAPTFAPPGRARTADGAGQPDGTGEAAGRHGEYARLARWLEPRTREYRELLHRSGMHSVQERMHATGTPPVAAIVITRELLGPAHHSLDDARGVVLADPVWDRLSGLYARTSGWLDDALKAL